MILNILNNHANELNDENKKQIGTYILQVDEENIFSIDVKKSFTKNGPDTVIVRLRYESNIEKYKDVFLPEDLEKYNNIVKSVLSKGLKDLYKVVSGYEDISKIHIDWVTNNDKIKLFKEFGSYDDYKKILDLYANQYNKMNDDIKTSQKTFSRKDIDSFTKNLESLLRSI